MQTVLLIEDNRLVKIVNERLLTKAGYKVVTAADGEEALSAARQACPDVILLDMMLPKLSGEEVLRALKQDPVTVHIPVIVVTGLSRKNEEKLRKAGADAFVEKEKLVDDAKPLAHLVEHILQQTAARKPAPLPTDASLSWTPDEIDSATKGSIESAGNRTQ
jgi:CheY-like chemotaxis protein